MNKTVVVKLTGDNALALQMSDALVSRELEARDRELAWSNARIDILRKRNSTYWAAKIAHSRYLFELDMKRSQNLRNRMEDKILCAILGFAIRVRNKLYNSGQDCSL